MIKKTRILGKLFTQISNFGISYLGNGLSYEAEILCGYGIELFKKPNILKLVLSLFFNLETQKLQNGWSQSSKILCESNLRKGLNYIKISAESDKRFAT